MWQRLNAWAKQLRKEVLTLWFAGRDPRTPWFAKLFALALAAYALSPIDLIPDFIPILGYLDEVILLPIGIWLCLRMVPPAVRLVSREKANAWLAQARGKPRSYAGAMIIAGLWIAVATAVGYYVWQWWSGHRA